MHFSFSRRRPGTLIPCFRILCAASVVLGLLVFQIPTPAPDQPSLVGETFTKGIAAGAPAEVENVGSPYGLCFQALATFDGNEGVCYDGTSIEEISLTGSLSPAPREFVRFDGNVYCDADGPNGRELYVYVESSTTLVADLNSTGDSNPTSLTVYDDGSGPDLYFAATDGTNGTELWRYAVGGNPTRLTDINPSGDANPSGLTVHNGDLYFSATDGTHGVELWRYEAGGSVSRLSDLNSSGDPNPTDLRVYTDNGSSGTDLYFSATDGSHGVELWAFEGSAPPVRRTDLNGSGDASPKDLTVYDDGSGADLYFSASAGSDRELWRYNADGTTSEVTDINSSGDANPKHLATYDDGSGTDLYFSADNGHDVELWRYNADGSTDEVSDVYASGSSYPRGLTVYDDGSGAALYFFAYDGRGIARLWRYDGAATPLTSGHNLWGGPTEKVVYDGSLYFRGRGGSSGAELWTYDGSNITKVSDVNAGPESSDPSNFAVYDDGGGADLYFAADNGGDGPELFQYDGFGTAQVEDINGGSSGSYPDDLTVYDDGTASGPDLYFSARGGSDGSELWRYESGSSASQKFDINSTSGSRPAHFVVYDDGGTSGADLYFGADGGSNGDELWRYESGNTAALVADVNGSGGSTPRALTVYNGLLYFVADGGSGGTELWAFNGSTKTRLTDIHAGGGSSFPVFPQLCVYDGKLFFPATDDGTEVELWRYDDSDGSVQQVVDLNVSRSSLPRDLIVYNDRLYFTAREASTGREPYAWDGTTAHSAEVHSGAASGGGRDPLVYDDGSGKKLFVSANDGASGVELWSFDKNSAPLPVELASLEAAQSGDRAVKLSWTTASETNNDGFRVHHRRLGMGERESGGMGVWEKAGFVEGSGTTTTAQSYQWSEDDLAIGTHRFRLVQVDLDGSTTNHDPISVDVGMTGPVTMSAPAPNPVRSQATVSFAVREAQTTSITVYNVLGQKVKTLYRGTPTAGESMIVRLSGDDLTSGLYFVRVGAGQHTRTQRMTVVK